MTERDRFLETVLFGSPDKVPLKPGFARKSTREAWYSQGLPRNVTDINEYAYRQAGGTLPWPKEGRGFPVNERMIPQYEELVLERRENSQIVQDWKGNICEIGNEYGVEYLRNPIDFVTRRWIKCPVEERADWEAMKLRYDPDDPARFPKNAAELGRRLAGREWIVEIGLSGPFWQVREWVGFERLCTLFYDDQAWLEEMFSFWSEYILKLLRQLFSYFIPDVIHLAEDMAYKEHAMISPAMARKYLLPAYRSWGEAIRGVGCPVYAMDSDGYVGELIPIWIEGGINVCDPMEVAAGNDIVRFRKEFGRDMAFRGAIDKRAMAKGGRVIEEEIAGVAPIIRDGGYIPGCDHGVPSDVSWRNYVRYVSLLAGETGWL